MNTIYFHRIDPTTNTHVFVAKILFTLGARSARDLFQSKDAVPAAIRTIRCNDEMGRKIISGEILLKYRRQKGIECIVEYVMDNCHTSGGFFDRLLADMQADLATYLPNPSAAVPGPLNDGQTLIEHIINEEAASIQNFLDEHAGTWGWLPWGWLPRAAQWGLKQSLSAILPYAPDVDMEIAIRLAKDNGHTDCFDILTAHHQKQRLSIAVAPVAAAASPTSTRKM